VIAVRTPSYTTSFLVAPNPSKLPQPRHIIFYSPLCFELFCFLGIFFPTSPLVVIPCRYDASIRPSAPLPHSLPGRPPLPFPLRYASSNTFAHLVFFCCRGQVTLIGRNFIVLASRRQLSFSSLLPFKEYPTTPAPLSTPVIFLDLGFVLPLAGAVGLSASSGPLLKDW